MNKKLIFVILIAMLVTFMTVTTVLAAPARATDGAKKTPDASETAKPGKGNSDSKPGNSGNNGNKPTKSPIYKVLNFQGIVMNVSSESMTLLRKDGTAVTLIFTPQSTVKVPTNSKNSTIADLQINMRVTVHAYMDLDTGEIYVRSINVIPGAPEQFNRVGTVSDYQPGVSITIADETGATQTFIVTVDTQIILQDPTLTLAVGSQVTIVTPLNDNADTPTAAAIVVTLPVDATATAEPTEVPSLEPTVEP
jgi:hypothetical protein